MRRRLVIKSLIIAFVILLIFVLSKVYHFMIINHVLEAIQEFKNEENRAYLVDIRMNENIVLQEETLVKQEIVKYTNRKDGLDLNYRWEDFKTNENYFINVNSKSIYADDEVIQSKNILPNLPNFIAHTSNEETKLSKILKIYYVIPTKYENKKCYKIVSRNEVIIIDKETYLPVYASLVTFDNNSNKIEKTYEFKVGEVTDENVALPDFGDYITAQ